jgi:hypothetical protein
MLGVRTVLSFLLLLLINPSLSLAVIEFEGTRRDTGAKVQIYMSVNDKNAVIRYFQQDGVAERYSTSVEDFKQTIEDAIHEKLKAFPESSKNSSERIANVLYHSALSDLRAFGKKGGFEREARLFEQSAEHLGIPKEEIDLIKANYREIVLSPFPEITGLFDVQVALPAVPAEPGVVAEPSTPSSVIEEPASRALNPRELLVPNAVVPLDPEMSGGSIEDLK